MPEDFDPYHRWLGIQREEQPADHYRLLGLVRFENDAEVIRDAASRQMAHVRSYQLGPQRELSQRILNELGAAKGCLLDPAKKAAYDHLLQERVGTSGSESSPTEAEQGEWGDLSPLSPNLQDGVWDLGEPLSAAPVSKPPQRPAPPNPTSAWLTGLLAALPTRLRQPAWLAPAIALAAVALLTVVGFRVGCSKPGTIPLASAGKPKVAVGETAVIAQGSGTKPDTTPTRGESAPSLGKARDNGPSRVQSGRVDANRAAFRFSRDGQQVAVKHSESLSLTGSMTLEAWIRPDPAAFTKLSFIASKNIDQTGYAIVVMGPRISFQYGASDLSSPASSVPAGQWAHVAAVWQDRSGTLYVNGGKAAQVAVPAPPRTNDSPLFIGSSQFGAGTSWRGSIAEVRIWSTARTAAEIKEQMNVRLTGKEAGLAAYWVFDQPGKQEVLDLSGHGNTACLGASPRPDQNDPEWTVRTPDGGKQLDTAASKSAPPPANASPQETRSRWLNESYGSTICHVQGKQWIETENKTQKIVAHLIETERNSEYVELSGFNFGVGRLCADKMVGKRKDKDQWDWVSSGHWLAPATNSSTATPEREPTRGRAPDLTNSIGMKFVLIGPGEFLMGSPDSDSQARPEENPQHRVRITKPFYLGTQEVTVGQFRQFVSASGYKSDAERDGKGGFGFDGNSWQQKPEYTWRNPGCQQTDEHPVVNVSWNDADAFCAWLSRKERKGFSLPTEAQWEYACRAGSTTKFCFGDGEADLGDYAWFKKNSEASTHPVGSKKPNPWGLYDMHGNVYEWCADWHDDKYHGESGADDPTGPTAGMCRTIRSSSWDCGPFDTRSALRRGYTPDTRHVGTGFRAARSP